MKETQINVVIPKAEENGGSILIADDDDTISKVLARYLEEAGYTCTFVSNGMETLQALRSMDFGVLLLDLNMPEMDGFEVLSAIQDSNLTVIPIVLTGMADVPAAVRAMKLGAFDFLAKPVNPDLLLQSVKRALRFRKVQLHVKKLNALSEQWEMSFNASSDPIIATDARGAIIRCNVAAADLVSATPAALVDRNSHAALCNQRHAPEACPFLVEIGSQPEESKEYLIWDGVYEINSGLMQDKRGRDWGHLHIARNVTERVQIQRALQENKLRIKSILDSIHTGVLVIDEEKHTIVEVNPQAASLIGLPREEIIGRVCHSFVCPAEEGRCPVTDLGQSIDTSERILLTADGTQRTILKTVTRATIDGRPCLIDSFLDITELKATEGALRENEEMLRVMTNVAKDAIMMMDETGKICFYNKAAEKILGWPEQEALGKSLHDVLSVSHHLEAEEKGKPSLLHSGQGAAMSKTLELTAFHKSGRKIPVEVSLSNFFLKENWHSVAIIRDISERKAVDEAMRASEEKLRQIVDNIGIGVALITPDMRILELNKQMRTWFPKVEPKESPICYRAFNSPPSTTICSYCPTIKTLQDGQVHEETTVTPQTDGAQNFRLVSSPIHDQEGNIIAAIEIVENITEKLRHEQELQQSQKLESVGRLAAGVAHEINTPTQYIGDNIEFLEIAFESLGELLTLVQSMASSDFDAKALPEMAQQASELIEEINLDYLSEQIPRAISQSLEGVSRVASIVQAMKEFSHPGREEKTLVHLNEGIQSTVMVSRNEWKYVADLETDLDPALPMVSCLPGEFNQVVLNMIVNAAHAIEDSLEEASGAKGKILIRSRLEGEWVEIRISDTGAGIPKEIQSQIFDPFFTTKEVGKGTGQGLSIARNVIVEKHGGSIALESEAGQGTTFIIRLPITG